MELKENGIYSNGKRIFRKIIRFEGDHVIFAKCYDHPKRGMYVIGNGIYSNTKILKSSFKQWVKQGVEDMGIVKCINCYSVLTGQEKNITSQLCNECYEEH